MGIFGLMTPGEVKKQIDAANANVEARIQDAVKAALSDNLPQWVLETADAQQFSTDYMGMYEAQATLYQKLSWVSSACTITAQAAALTPFNVKRIVGEQEKDIKNHPFELLLRRPNPKDSRFAFLTATVLMWMLNGNAYWWLNRESENDPPDEIWFIPPHMMVPKPNDQMYLEGYLYYPGNGNEILLPPHEIVHFQRFNPFNMFVGMSAVESIAYASKGDLAMQGWNVKLFGENNARLASILAVSDMVQDTPWQKMKEDIREASKKKEMLMLRGVGPGGLQWIQNAFSQKDMEFLEGRKFNKEEIWSVLAPGLMSMLSENATEANSRTGEAVFNRYTVYPIHVLMSEQITSDILPAYGSEKARPLVGEFDDVRIADKAMELQEIQEYAKYHTLGEVRVNKYNDNPLGDERDDLLSAQINAQSGGIQKPPTPPSSFNPQNQPDQQPAPDQEEPEDEQPDAAKAQIFEQLAKWRNHCRKDIGGNRYLTFDTTYLPASVVTYVHQAMPTVKSRAALEAVFDQARDLVRGGPAKVAGPTDAATVLEGIRLAIATKRMQNA